MPAQIRFQPTLFLFLGTSAGQIGWRVKKLLHQSYGKVPVLKFLWIDLDSTVDPQARPWFSSSERAELSGFNPAAVIKNINHYPQIKDWWPDTGVPAGMLAGGSGAPQQMRLVGRLAFFRMFNDRSRGEALIDKLRSATEALFEIDNIKATEAKSNDLMTYSVESGCRVVIVFSACGGSGSSYAHDLAYLCRDLLAGKDPTIISISVLPPVIDKAIHSETQIQKEKIRANAYAWFKEDNALTVRPYWNVEYPEGGTIEVDAPPFDYRYIIDMENQAGYRLNSIDDVYTMIAQSIFMDTGSSIGGAMRGFTANVFALSDEFEGMRRSFSSLAAASLIYPKARLLDYCSSRLAGALIKEGLLQSSDDHTVRAATSTLLAQLHLRDDDLLGELTRLCPVKLGLEPIIMKADSVAAAVAQADAQEVQNQSARRGEVEKMQRYAADLLETLKSQVDLEITRSVSIGGLRFAIALIDRLLDQPTPGPIESTAISLESMKARILQQGCTDADLKAARAGYDRARSALKGLDDGIEDALERMVSMKGWMRKFTLFKRDALSAMMQINENYIQLAAQQQAISIYDQLATLLKDLKVRLQSTASALDIMADDVIQEAKNLDNKAENQVGQYEFMQEIGIDFPGYYQENAVHVKPAEVFRGMLPANALDGVAALAKWVEQDAKTSATRYASSYFVDRLERTSLLSTLQEMAVHKGQEPAELVEEYLNRLVNYCHPFWRYDQNAGLNDTEGKSMIGVEDENSTLLPASYRNSSLYEIKTTGVRDRIDVVRIRHGLPAFLIRGMNEWKAIYERKRKSTDPLHVLPDMEFAPDLMPEKDKQNRDVFAIALAFGYIVQVGSWYYYDPEKGYITDKIQPGKEFRLAQGREKAEDAFSHRDEWVHKTIESVDAEVRNIGNEAAIRKLDGMIECYKNDIAQMKSGDEAMRKQYEREMLALIKMQHVLGKVG